MNQICLAVPVPMGRTGHARRLMQQLDGAPSVNHDCFAQRLGIHKAVWYLAATALGDLLIAFLELDDLGQTAARLARSHDDFDVWFNASFRDATGVDLRAGEQIPLPELLCSWEDAAKTSHRSVVDPSHLSDKPERDSQ